MRNWVALSCMIDAINKRKLRMNPSTFSFPTATSVFLAGLGVDSFLPEGTIEFRDMDSVIGKIINVGKE